MLGLLASITVVTTVFSVGCMDESLAEDDFVDVGETDDGRIPQTILDVAPGRTRTLSFGCSEYFSCDASLRVDISPVTISRVVADAHGALGDLQPGENEFSEGLFEYTLLIDGRQGGRGTVYFNAYLHASDSGEFEDYTWDLTILNTAGQVGMRDHLALTMSSLDPDADVALRLTSMYGSPIELDFRAEWY